MTLSDNYVYLTGQRGGRIIRVSHDGANRNTLHTGYDYIFNLQAASDDTLYATVINKGRSHLIRTDNSGQSWRPVFSAEHLGFVGVQSPDEVIVIAHHGALSTPNGVISKSTDGGETWIDSDWTHGLFMYVILKSGQVDPGSSWVQINDRLLSFTFKPTEAEKKRN